MLSVVVEGRLVGPWVDELRRVADCGRPSGQLTIDLCGLTAMDAGGHALLDELLRSGATLRCSDVMNQYLVEQMAGPVGDLRDACRPCRGFTSVDDGDRGEDAFASLKAS